MTGRERIMAVLRGEKADRVPIWLREGFPILKGPADEDDFSSGWQAAPLYRRLYDYVLPHVDAIEGGFGIPALQPMMVPKKTIRSDMIVENREVRRIRQRIATPKGELVGIKEMRRGVNTKWIVKHLVTNREELKKIAAIPFEIDPQDIEYCYEQYTYAFNRVGARGVLRLPLSSPIKIISGCMPMELLYEISMTDRTWLHELLDEVTTRVVAVLDALFLRFRLDTIANLGGSEQCTPPMMGPEGFDEFVVPYDGRIIQKLKEEGILVNLHCHGKIRRVIRRFVAMGAGSTDPVEPPPNGDITFQEAREMVGDDLTLIGNLEFSDLEFSEPKHIRRMVREILTLGTSRIILSSSAGPFSAITPRIAENYRAWIDAVLEYGG